MYRKVIENPYIRISIRRLKSKKRAKILGSRFAEAVPPAESLKAHQLLGGEAAEDGDWLGRYIRTAIGAFSLLIRRTVVIQGCINFMIALLPSPP